MSNWFKKSQTGPVQGVRYRAVVPIDIWIDSKGDQQLDQEEAYRQLKNILSIGAEQMTVNGFKEYLQIGDVKPYSNF